MARYEKQKSGSIKAIVRRSVKGEKVFESKTFKTKHEAIRWAVAMEDSITDGSYFLSKEGYKLENEVNPLSTLRDLLEKYEKTYTWEKNSSKSESRKITNLLVNYKELCDTPLYQVDVPFLNRLVTARKQSGVKNSTVRLDLFLISAAFSKAGLMGFGDLKNPVHSSAFKLPKPTKTRKRVFQNNGEEKELYQQLTGHPNPEFRCMVLLAITTSLRQGNIVGLRKSQINENNKFIHIPSEESKNRHEFFVPITNEVSKILSSYYVEKAKDLDDKIQSIQSLLQSPCSPSRRYKLVKQLDRAQTEKENWSKGERIFTLSQAGLSNAWKKFRAELQKKKYLLDFRFHDLRRVAITRFFELGLTIPQVASISSHKTWRMLKCYENMQVAEKLAIEINQKISGEFP